MCIRKTIPHHSINSRKGISSSIKYKFFVSQFCLLEYSTLWSSQAYFLLAEMKSVCVTVLFDLKKKKHKEYSNQSSLHRDNCTAREIEAYGYAFLEGMKS